MFILQAITLCAIKCSGYSRLWYSSIKTWHLHACDTRVSEQISHKTRKIIKIYVYTHVTLESLNKFIVSLASCTRVQNKFVRLLVCCTQALNKFVGPLVNCTQAHDLMHSWSAGTYHVVCKIYAWPQHLWIRLQLTHQVVYSHCSLFHQLQPIIIQYHPDCSLDPSASTY